MCVSWSLWIGFMRSFRIQSFSLSSTTILLLEEYDGKQERSFEFKDRGRSVNSDVRAPVLCHPHYPRGFYNVYRLLSSLLLSLTKIDEEKKYLEIIKTR